MYKKTSGAFFLKYGSILNDEKYRECYHSKSEFTINKNETVKDFFAYEKDIIIECLKGIAILLIYDNGEINGFVLHRTVILKANVYINVVSISEDAEINLLSKEDSQVKLLKLITPYRIERNKKSFEIKEIYAYYYNIRKPGYLFKGEKNPCFELTYVDKGSLEMKIDGKEFQINKNELLVSCPNQFHSQHVSSNQSCSYLSIIFECDLKDYRSLLNKIFKVNSEILKVLNKFVNNTYLECPYKGDIILNDLKSIIIFLLQYGNDKISQSLSPIQQKYETDLINKIINYIELKVDEPLSLFDLCDEFSISRSGIQKLFKNNLNKAPKQYINELKLKRACLLIAEGKYTISQIALMLGFNSIHYFSRKFHKRFDITPSEYAKSIFKNQLK